MRNLLYLGLSALAGLIMAVGLLVTLYEALQVAPEAKKGQTGRLHYHLKNVTRLGGTEDDVARAVARAVFLDESVPERAADWKAALLANLRVDDNVRHVVGLASEGAMAPAWSLPGAFWAVFAGAPVVFIGRDSYPAETSDLLRKHNVPLYVMAPEGLVSDAVVERLSGIVPTERVTGDNLAGHAVKVAEYRNWETGFGWGRDQSQRDGYFQYTITTPAEFAVGYAALPLARSNATTFLFAANDGSLPAETERYLWSIRATFYVTPSEGPFRHLWIVGDRVSYASQGRADLAIEKAPYASMGPVSLGPMESLLLGIIALGLAGGTFVLIHGMVFMQDVMLPLRLAWAWTATLLPVAGVILYFAAYRRPRASDGGMKMLERPPGMQAAAATAMSFGYGAPVMIAIGYLFVFFGFPLFFEEDFSSGWWFLLGAGMPLMMLGMYIGAILLIWPSVQLNMKAMWKGVPRRRVLWSALGTTVVSMSAVSLGMMTMAWWMMMAKLPMMPKEDELLWFGSLWLAAIVGFLIAWPLNLVMVRIGLKPGTM